MKHVILLGLLLLSCALQAHADEGTIEETDDAIIIEFSGTGGGRLNADQAQPVPSPAPEPRFEPPPEPPPAPVEQPPLPEQLPAPMEQQQSPAEQAPAASPPDGTTAAPPL